MVGDGEEGEAVGRPPAPSLETAESEEEREEDNEEVDGDEEGEEDEFGDFEEAAAASDEPAPSNAPSYSRDAVTPPPSPQPPPQPISEFLDDQSLWDLTSDHDDAECAGTSDEDSQSAPSQSYYDLVAMFDGVTEGCGQDDGRTQQTQSVSASVTGLWRALHCIEETPALRFQWLTSRAFAKLLFALEISDSTTTNATTTTTTNTPLARQTTDHLTKRADHDGQGAAGVALDSLSVPPADFDWQSAGLSNPLKGSSAISSMSAMLECDEFFKAHSSATGGAVKGCDAQSILGRDLRAMGIDVGAGAMSNLSNGGHILSAGSILEQGTSKITVDELLARNEHRHENDPEGKCPSRSSVGASSNVAKTYKTREDLSSDEARALHDRLPDLSYMLSDRLIFPATPPHAAEGGAKTSSIHEGNCDPLD